MTVPHQGKTQLRQYYLNLRQSISQSQRNLASAEIYERLFELPQWQNAPIICGYMSIRGEIDTLPILEKALNDGKTLALPRTISNAKQGQMVFCQVPDISSNSLATGRFGVSEPMESCPIITSASLSHALILLPGLAFDSTGYRIGYGGGYYDRYISNLILQNIPFTTIALAFSLFVADALPHEPHDQPAHIIVTERRVYHPHGQS